MPMKNRNYKQEYATAKARGENKGCAMRHKARRMVEKEVGDLPSSVEIDHKKPIRAGGTSARGNLRKRPASANKADNGQYPGMKKSGKKRNV
ncbi:MAG: hypothetical protein H7831_17130 [Magnetococcus sp. WYHC-3]